MSGVLSSLFDLSGFFFMFTLNLLVICLICYYFKRRMETLEHAQMEQSKILRTYIQETNNINNKPEVRQETVEEAKKIETNNDFNNQPFKKIEINQFTLQKDEDSESEDTSDEEYDDDELGENIELVEENSNIKVLRLNQDIDEDESETDDDDDDDDDDNDDDDNDHDDNNDKEEEEDKKEETSENTKKLNLEIDYNKHTAKELKLMCKEKGLTGFNNLKKTELVELLNNTNNIKQEIVEEINNTNEIEIKQEDVNILDIKNLNKENFNIDNDITLDIIEP